MPSITANPDVYLVPNNAPYNGASVLANDVNTAGTAMMAGSRSPTTTRGTNLLNANGTFVYTPAAAAPGDAWLDQFRYIAWNVDNPNDPNAVSTAYLIVANVPPPPGGGGNRAPIIAQMPPQNDVEGYSVRVQVFAADPDNDAITYTGQNLPGGLSIDLSTGLITGKLAYTCARSYNVTITVTDARAAFGTMNFTWNVADATIGTLRGTERNSGNPLPNSVTVAGLAETVFYISPGNTMRLQVADPAAGNGAQGADTLYSLVGSGATPASGAFSTEPFVDISFSGAATNFWVNAGVDLNADATLQDGEISHRFAVRIISFADATVGARRVSNPVESTLTTVQSSEHFETGGTFWFEVVGGVTGRAAGTPGWPNGSMVSWELWQSSWPNVKLLSGRGNAALVTLSPFPDGTDSANCYFRFYADANNNGTYNSGELQMASAAQTVFTVKRPRVFEIKVGVSQRIIDETPAGAGFLAGIQGLFDSARDLLLRKDSEDDWRAAVQLTVAAVQRFAPDPATWPDPCPYSISEMAKHWDNLTTDIDFIKTLGNNIPAATGQDQFFRGSWHKIIIAFDQNGNGDPGLLAQAIAHEIGHGVGLDHPFPDDDSTKYLVMSVIRPGSHDHLLNLDQAVAYETQSLEPETPFNQNSATRQALALGKTAPSLFSATPMTPEPGLAALPIPELMLPMWSAAPVSPIVWEPIPLRESASVLAWSMPTTVYDEDWQRPSRLELAEQEGVFDDFWGIPAMHHHAEEFQWNG